MGTSTLRLFATGKWDSNALGDKVFGALFKNRPHPKAATQNGTNNKSKLAKVVKRKPNKKARKDKLKQTATLLQSDKGRVSKTSEGEQRHFKPQLLQNMNAKRNKKKMTGMREEDRHETNRIAVNKERLQVKKKTKKKIKTNHQQQITKKKERAEAVSNGSLQSEQLLQANKKGISLRERMLEKLKSARFRYLNEQMYTSEGKQAKHFFEKDEQAYEAYHVGYRQQVSKWPINPVDVIIRKIKKLPKDQIVADFGCGEAKLATSVPQTVHSFDLVPANERVTSCDMARVPLEPNSVDVAVFCLSLMGTNLKDYILEANRVLKLGGLLKIAEVESRLDNVDDFVKSLKSFGFTLKCKNLSHNLFYFLDLKKAADVKRKKTLPQLALKPCLYKKR